MKYPITPEYIEAAPDAISELYIGLQDYILDYVCAQFKTGDANAKAIELVRLLQRRGLDIEDIEREIKRVLRLTDREFDQIFADAIKRNEQYYGAALDKAGLLRDTYRAETMAAEIAAITAQTKGELVNITQSMGFATRGADGRLTYKPIAKAYHAALDKAEIKVWSGAVSYQQAAKEAVDELCTSGIQWVDYESGHHNRIDVAARRAVRTGITQISAKYSDALIEELGTDYLEVTAHGGARDIDGPSPWSNHKAWQGRVYSFRSGDIYPSVYAVCGLGYVDGLLGANCRHLYHAWIEGVSERTYTDEELANIDPPPFEFEGKEYTAYKATQMMRKLETAIRTSKRKLVGYKASGSEEAYTDESIRLRRLREEYKSFSGKSGIKEHPELLTVKEFGRKEAAQARGRYAAEMATKTNPLIPRTEDGIVIPSKTIYGHTAPIKFSEELANSIVQRYNDQGVLTTRAYYNSEGWKIKEVQFTDHGNSKHHPYGANGEHADVYHWNEDGSLNHKRSRELSEAERKENGDVLKNE